MKVYLLFLFCTLSFHPSTKNNATLDTMTYLSSTVEVIVSDTQVKLQDTTNLCRFFNKKGKECSYSSITKEMDFTEFYIIKNISPKQVYRILQKEKYDLYDSSFIPLGFELQNYNEFQNTTYSRFSQRVVRNKEKIDSLLLNFSFDGGETYI
ncbi:hypothetical protein V9L05_24145 (plasmid) [Bernardetia sp. Wsw4-3y2]|uniref:hypothetical protein n=1 Tax=Bernardetia sp. Wsw4-3y2 TaxID=3127471 RepID=UPI0030D5F7A0